MMSIGSNLFVCRGGLPDKTYMDPEALNRLIARNLEALMAEKDLNMSAWAKAAGMGHTGVRDIIQGKVKNPTYRTLLSLAEVAGVDVRRITVGPEFESLSPADAEALDLLSQLEPAERQILLNAARAQIAARSQPEDEEFREESK